MKKTALLLLLCVMSVRAYAVNGCIAYSGLPGIITYPGAVAVSSTLKYGDMIPGTQRPFAASGVCRLGASNAGAGGPSIQVGSRIVMCTMNGGSTEISSGIYSTGVTGVGMRVRDSSGNAITSATSQACASQISTIGSGGSYNFSGTLELVRTTGTIPSGAVLTKAGTQWAFGVYNTGIIMNDDNGNIYTGSSSISASGNIVFRSLTCTVSAPASVAMKQTRLAMFPNIGNVDGATPFNVSLQCNDRAQVGMTMDAVSGYGVVDAANGVIGISQQSGAAKGFGLQITRSNGAVMPMRTRVDLGSITANTLNNYGFNVQYRRIASPVLSGTVTSGLILTMDYQ